MTDEHPPARATGVGTDAYPPDLPALFLNHLGKERAAAGLSLEELAGRSGIDPRLYAEIEEGRLLPRFAELERLRANLGDIPAAKLYGYSVLNTVGDHRFWQDDPNFQRFYESMNDASHLLVAPDEALWLDRVSTPDREVEVFVNLSCSAQFVPHLMLDTAAALQALGVSFASGSGRAFCCGTYYRRMGKLEGADRMNAASVARSISWGAETAAHMCTQCVLTFSEIARRQAFESGEVQPLRHVQLLRFLDERLEELGGDVPWVREVHARVVTHGHPAYSPVHDIAKRDVARIAARIPGVEVVGTLDRTTFDSFCDSEPGEWKRPRPTTRDEVEEYRRELETVVGSWGADTVSPSHQTCLQMWEPFAGDVVRVRHVVSLLAEALGVGHPDRYVAASRLGDTDAIVEQTRPVWSAWGMPQERAVEAARITFDPAYRTVGMCGCGKGPDERCGHAEPQLIGIDVLRGERT